jgi:hypothetical protein
MHVWHARIDSIIVTLSHVLVHTATLLDEAARRSTSRVYARETVSTLHI